jgi:carboxymethylenebutenolidase
MRRLIALAITLAFAPFTHAQDWAKAQLEKSSRHGEWVKVKHGDRIVEAWVVYPEVKDKATAVLVIHEIFGLTDWVRLTADELAAAGYIAIAPDLLSGMGPKGGGTAELGQGVGKAIRDLPPEQITKDLTACVDYAIKLPAANGKAAACGFCWGGSQVFRFATTNTTIKAAMPFYGSGPEKAEEIAKIDCPVYGFYGSDDARVNATIPKSTELMKAANKVYEPKTYEGAGHGFFRAGAMPDAKEPNKKAREEAWKRVKEILGKL